MRCSEYKEKEQCEKAATLYLLHPDGSRNPGGWVCSGHGDVILSEYREKLSEKWLTEPIKKEEEDETFSVQNQ